MLEHMARVIGPKGLELIEPDTFRLTIGCPTNCIHCGMCPEPRLLYVLPLKDFLSYVKAIDKTQLRTGINLLANYLLTGTDSDPFYNPEFGEMCKALYETLGKKFYAVTSGWLPNAKSSQQAAELIAKNPEIVEKVQLTLSHFPRHEKFKRDHPGLLANIIETFGPLGDKLIISPQYAEGHEEYSLERTLELLDDSLYLLGKSRQDFTICERAVIGAGRSKEELGILTMRLINTIAEEPAPPISRYPERPFSGLFDTWGCLLVLKEQRGFYTRNIEDYRPAENAIPAYLYQEAA